MHRLSGIIWWRLGLGILRLNYIVPSGLAYLRIEIRCVRTKVGTEVIYRFEKIDDEATIDVMKFWEMPPDEASASSDGESDGPDGGADTKSNGSEMGNTEGEACT